MKVCNELSQFELAILRAASRALQAYRLAKGLNRDGLPYKGLTR